MEVLILLIIAGAIVWIYIKTSSNTKKNIDNEQVNENVNIVYSDAYEPRYLMTLNEKAQFKKIQHWAQSRGLLVFTKVRLSDLIAPRKDQKNFKGLFWKIQAKHVDFLICDNDISVKCIIEISDNSHKQAKRAERDKFVADVLQSCGYKIIETYNIEEAELDKTCDTTLTHIN